MQRAVPSPADRPAMFIVMQLRAESGFDGGRLAAQLDQPAGGILGDDLESRVPREAAHCFDVRRMIALALRAERPARQGLCCGRLPHGLEIQADGDRFVGRNPPDRLHAARRGMLAACQYLSVVDHVTPPWKVHRETRATGPGSPPCRPDAPNRSGCRAVHEPLRDIAGSLAAHPWHDGMTLGAG
ncbi:MAG TPA: hypothetical protein VGC28_07185 [Sphingomonas sp.]